MGVVATGVGLMVDCGTVDVLDPDSGGGGDDPDNPDDGGGETPSVSPSDITTSQCSPSLATVEQPIETGDTVPFRFEVEYPTDVVTGETIELDVEWSFDNAPTQTRTVQMTTTRAFAFDFSFTQPGTYQPEYEVVDARIV